MSTKAPLSLKLLPFLLFAVLAGCSGDAAKINSVVSPAPSPVSPPVVVTAEPASAGEADTAGLTREQRLEDFDYLYMILEANYPFFAVNKRLNGVDWLANKATYREQIATDAGGDLQFYGTLNKIVAELHNGHTYVLDRDTYSYFRQIYDNQPEMKPWSAVLQQKQVLARYGADEAGAVTSASTPVPATFQGSNIFHRTLVEGESAYLAIKGFASQYIEADHAELREFLTEVKNYRALILDIRGNPGGSQLYWMNLVAMLVDHNLPYEEYLLFRGGEYAKPFITSAGFELKPVQELDLGKLPNSPPEAAADFPEFMVHAYNITPDPVGFKGKIYLLVDQEVYSAAEAFAVYAKGTGFATLIGEKTGGDGIGATPLVAALPNSGYVLNFSYVLGLTADGTLDEEYKTEPDVTVNAAKNRDWHKDPAIQKALELAGLQ